MPDYLDDPDFLKWLERANAIAKRQERLAADIAAFRSEAEAARNAGIGCPADDQQVQEVQ